MRNASIVGNTDACIPHFKKEHYTMGSAIPLIF